MISLTDMEIVARTHPSLEMAVIGCGLGFHGAGESIQASPSQQLGPTRASWPGAHALKRWRCEEAQGGMAAQG